MEVGSARLTMTQVLFRAATGLSVWREYYRHPPFAHHRESPSFIEKTESEPSSATQASFSTKLVETGPTDWVLT